MSDKGMIVVTAAVVVVDRVFDSTIFAATSSAKDEILPDGMNSISFFGDIMIELTFVPRRVSFLGERFGELLDDKSIRGDRTGDNLFDVVFIGLLFGETVVKFAVIFGDWLLSFDSFIPPYLQ
jgi:hypothetical protein